eukprot:m.156479 g.156479  ORF g.156479 m.156479 type:complete len:720 (+) comp13340_c0_seq5:51-2210(+)
MKKTKQLKLKNFRAPKRNAAFSFKDDWDVLRGAVEAVLAHTPTKETLNGLSARVERNLHPSSALMYSNLKSLISAHLKNEKKKLQQCLSHTELVFIQTVAATWNTFKRDMHLIRSIFIHLNQELVATARDEQLWPMGSSLFRRIMFSEQTIHDAMVAQFLMTVTQDRNGEAADTNVLRSISTMCSELFMYKMSIEAPLEEETRKYYTREGSKLSDELKLPDFLQNANRRVGEEEFRCNTYLQSTTRENIKIIVIQTLIGANTAYIEDGFRSLMDNDDSLSLRLLYSFMRTLRQLDLFITFFKDFIKREGEAIVKTPSEDNLMVKRLVDFRTKVLRIVKTSFSSTSSHTIMSEKATECFRFFINLRANKPAELIALFLDSLLKRGFKQYSDAELHKLIDNVIEVFRFVDGKDVFEGFYKKHLSRRLILDKIASNDLEIMLISKLKQECGSDFTASLEEMFKDISISTDLTSSFKASHPEISVGLKALVLKKSTWPTIPPVNVQLPQELLTIRNAFVDFYATKHKNRLLHWQSSLSTCSLRVNFAAGTKDLQMSLYQAIILLKFNSKDTWTYSELQRETMLDDHPLRLALTSLACGKVRVLLKTPKNRHVRKKDSFKVNVSFSNERRKIKINQLQLKQTKEETEATVAKVFEDRKLSVDAAIVRTMKMRKSLLHQKLIAELMSQLRFPVRPVDLKKRIEVMLDREYMERDKDDNNLYHYVA